MGAERLLAAERGGEKIAVEVKSFLASASTISEFHTALGQFINYRAALRREEPGSAARRQPSHSLFSCARSNL